MVSKSKQALLKAELGAGWISDAESASPQGKCTFHRQWKPASLLGVGCLFGMTYAYWVFTPGISQVDNLDALKGFSNHTSSEKYYWPSPRGPVGSPSNSPYEGPLTVTKPTWSWYYSCCFLCKWCTFFDGTVIDDQKNIYATGGDVIRKFSSDGELLWASRKQKRDFIFFASTLMDGAVYGMANIFTKEFPMMGCRLFALCMDTGKQLWSVNLPGQATNNGHVSAYQGIVIVASDLAPAGPSDHKVFGLNSTDGNVLWTYTLDTPVWNFGVAFPGDGTFVYQNYEGTVHRHFVNNGTLIWKTGGFHNSWTDGIANLGNNGIVYGVANTAGQFPPGLNGSLSAYSLSSGKMLWSRDLPKPVNSMPAVGMLVGYSRPSVVMPVGRQAVAGERIDIYAFDAETGEDHWVFKGPTQLNSPMPLGELRADTQAQRSLNGIPMPQTPNPWTHPVIDGNGAVFIGSITGHFFRLQDSNGDGKIEDPEEVSTLATEADFYLASGASVAPGLMATANAQSLYVWKY